MLSNVPSLGGNILLFNILISPSPFLLQGYLESFLIVYLLDLPSLANTNGEESTQHSIWRNSAMIQDLDRSIGSSLGNLDPHGPPMLAWMLSQ